MRGDLVDALRALLRGGAIWVEYRDKEAGDAVAWSRARDLAAVCRDSGARLIVNDRVDVALAAEADGVHLGQDDLPVTTARALLGAGALIGASVDTVEEARRADADAVSYIAVGPVFTTTSKADAGPVVGLDGVHTVAASIEAPLVGIGGIDADNAAAVVAAGCDGVAVLSALFAGASIEAATSRLIEAVRSGFELRND